MSIARLEVRSLAASRGPVTLFRDLSFALVPGEIAAVRGPNGSGKTTLLRCVAGLTQPEAGDVVREGGILFLGHLPGIKDDLTAEENLEFALRMQGVDADATKIRTALSVVGLEGKRRVPARRLSAGQRRRIGLARLTLSTTTGLWILDEPLASLDASGEEWLGGMLEAHAGRGGIALVATHHPLPLAKITPRDIAIGP
ncbi:Cytochrome c biogenesis ATP-binding export protein CcmA [Usitatibacter rugosus]|uniref:Cytochrome c biogenesis ATP-binding export protein CcmA n=1 Tax=Usitatibacter rugosus TaxID=2732067 RepID=A0A6M4GV79_9PROT|nr:cytochrome c biogenesis heme-transporting ATPase CcmA [Usitatibacter rugosus]QJR10915.1 Cytochrome c biogenesis ATP-binding export protein CcmA [Usitatibacter rugosus]